MKTPLIALTLLSLTLSSALISACSSKQSKVETSASEPTTAPVAEQQQQMANDANLGASSSGRGR